MRQILSARIFMEPNERRSSVASAVPGSLFQLAKASSAWDGGAVRLSALTNKASEMRSNLSFIYILFNSSTNSSLSLSDSFAWCLNPFYRFPSGEGFKRGLQPVLKSVFYMIFFKGTGLYLHVNAPLKLGDQTIRDELYVLTVGIIIIF